ncbi:MAG: LysR family transcriptional regulator [Labilithrix sp.]
MELDALAMFIEVVKSGSFLAAATTMGVPRPTLRRRIGELEARTGVPLLVRSRQGVVATEAGKVLADRARAVIDEATALVTHVREIGTATLGRLRIVAPVGLPPQLFAPFLTMMVATYPKIRFETTFEADPVSKAPSDADVVLTFGGGEPPEGWVPFDLMSTPEMLVASRSYLKEHGTPSDPDDLADRRLLAWAPPDADPRVWPVGGDGELDVEPWLITTDVHMLHQAAIAGLGIAFVPRAELPIPGPEDDSLVVVLPKIRRARSLRAFVPAALVESPRIRAGLTMFDRIRLPPTK